MSYLTDLTDENILHARVIARCQAILAIQEKYPTKSYPIRAIEYFPIGADACGDLIEIHLKSRYDSDDCEDFSIPSKLFDTGTDEELHLFFRNEAETFRLRNARDAAERQLAIERQEKATLRELQAKYGQVIER